VSPTQHERILKKSIASSPQRPSSSKAITVNLVKGKRPITTAQTSR
jgi:hypothetical protein